jgi:hypothetical protein
MKQEEHQGLNFHGITLIVGSGAGTAAQVFGSWAKLFSLGPKQLTLTGLYATTVGAKKPGKYAAIQSSRESMVKTLGTLAYQCEEVVRSPGKAFLLHLGL